MAWTLAQIAEHIAGEVIGNAELSIDSFACLQNANASQISFLASSKYKSYLTTTKAGAVIVSADLADQAKCSVIVVADPYLAYAKAASLFKIPRHYQPGAHASAVVDPETSIHPTVAIGPQAIIEAGVTIKQGTIIGAGCIVKSGVKIGEDTQLTANITLCEDVHLGKRCLIHPGVVIGSDGFGFANDNGNWIKIPQLGSVVIGDDVEIGANTTIDRGAIEDTLIGNGSKLDNQIHIAHNVTIGENTVIAACTGVAGSATIGNNCMIGGACGILGHLAITNNVTITPMTLVTKSITTPGSYSSGSPAEPTQQWRKNIARYRQLGTLTERVKQLEVGK